MPRWIGLLLATALLFAGIFAIKGILLPFIAGLAVAYFLDPAADKLEAWGLPRWLATVAILVAFFILGTLLMALIWPLAVSQISGIAQAFPDYITKIKPLVLDLVDQAGPERAKELVSQLTGRLAEIAGNVAQNVISGGLALFNLISLLLITPVVSFYLLRDWDRMTAQIDSWLPRKYEPVIKDLLQQSDDVLAGFVRGQVLVVIAEAILYAAGWTMLGLEYGLVLGILAGVLAFIPFVGPLFAVGMSLIIAVGQFGDNYLMIGAVFSVFLVVQAIEGMVLQPRFIGERVGLHAVWVLLAVFAGGHLMGFVGVLIALPVAAVIAVLMRFALKQYLKSDLYHDGHQGEDISTELEQPQEVNT
ncbi:MAG: AI-2E family transporter [Sphingomonadales bacterium]|jgi:predicted PurR-regulated permease PerM